MLQPWFSKAKLGIFIHWGIYSVKPTGESWPFWLGEISYDDYMRQCDGFEAEKWSPTQWAKLFKEVGANYAVLTTKHHDGVALWDTKQNDLSTVKQCAAKRDLVAPYCNALRAEGLNVGLYYSHLDWSHPDYASLPMRRLHDKDPADACKQNKFSFNGTLDYKRWEKFLTFHRAQLKELCTEYGPIDLLWFDGDWERTSEQWRMKQLVEQMQLWQPGCMFNQRLGGYGDYQTPEQAFPVIAPDGRWEFCMTLNDFWGYMPSNTNYKSIHYIVRTFAETISRGGNLLLDIGPRADGTIPEEQVERLKGLGAWIERYKEAIYPTGAGLPQGLFHGASTLTEDKKTLYLIFFDDPKEGIIVKGVGNKIPISKITSLQTSQELSYQRFGPSWAQTPAQLWITIPKECLDPVASVVKVEFEHPLELEMKRGEVIEVNC